MPNIKQVQADMDMVGTFKVIAQAFEEISVMRMRKVRDSVINSREFIKKLSSVFYDVKSSYKDEMAKVEAHAKSMAKNTQLPIPQPTKKDLTVLISANTKLYGYITTQVFHSFFESIKDKQTDLMIVGKLGKDLYEQQENHRPFLFFEVPDGDVNMNDVQALLFHLLQYENINVFYAQFDSILHQLPETANITGEQPFNLPDNSGLPPPKHKFVFEPSVEEILLFFKSQVFVALFKQTIDEAHLAHFGSRIGAMEEALVHIESMTKKLAMEQRRFKKMVEGKRTLERVAGMRALSSR